MRRILLVLLVLLVVVQFFPSARNLGTTDGPNHISKVYPVPPAVESIFQKACYDCHSNHTTYPWYARVQPFGWWLAAHIKDGKKHLNFSEFARLPAERQAHKLEEVMEMVEKGEMPLRSYTLIHRDALLTPAEREILLNWARPGAAQAEKQEARGERPEGDELEDRP